MYYLLLGSNDPPIFIKDRELADVTPLRVHNNAHRIFRHNYTGELFKLYFMPANSKTKTRTDKHMEIF